MRGALAVTVSRTLVLLTTCSFETFFVLFCFVFAALVLVGLLFPERPWTD